MPHKGPTIFIDRNSGGKTFRSLIAAEGISVVLHTEYFGKEGNPDDDEWLLEISKKGWVMLSGDLATAKSALFLQKLSHTKADVFLLQDINGMSPEGRAQLIIDIYPIIVDIAGSCPKPSLWIIKDGRARSLDWRDRLSKYRRYKRV